MTSPATHEDFSGEVVRWGQAPLTFELRSSDVTLLRRAATIFRPWQCSSSREVVCSWTAEPIWHASRQVWEIRSSQSEEIRHRDQRSQALLAIEFLAIQTLLEHPQCLLSLHGALVAKQGRGVLIVGRGESGKSTLACALWQSGWSLLCDDATLVDIAHGVAYPTPRRVSLRSPSRTLLGEALWTRISQTPSCDYTTEGCVFHPDEVDNSERLPSVPLVAVLFLGRSGSTVAAAACQRVAPAHALLALAPYSSYIRRYEMWETIRRLRPLVMTLPVYDLGRGALPDMILSLESVLSEVA